MKKAPEKKKTVFRRVMTALLLVISAAFLFFVISNVMIIMTEGKKIAKEEELMSFRPDCILIFGAGVWENGVPSPILADRLDEGARLYKKGAADRILVSGDHGRAEYDEVNAMKRYLVNAGVPSEHIFMDHAGFSTYESVVRAKEVFGVRKAILVTQKYHLYRALYIAEHTGVEAIGSGADPRMYAGQTYRTVREWISRDKDLIYCLFRVKPRFLGDPVDMRGDGNATDG